MSDFEQKERLGKGAFGIVRHVIEKNTQRHMAWKEMDYEEDEDEVKQMVINEKDQALNAYRILAQAVNSQQQFLHVVQPLGFFVNEDIHRAYLVMEYCSGGDLRKYINNMRKSGMEISPKKCYQIMWQIGSSLCQLHTSMIMHMDLKPENVLLNEEFMVKLSDFGLSRQLQVGREYVTAHGGTFLFQAPEVLRNKSKEKKEKGPKQKIVQTPACDIWAFGVMMFELLAQRHPFFDSQDEDIPAEEFIQRVVNLPPAELPDHYPLRLRNLIKQMLEKDPSQRISAEEILNVPEVAAQLPGK
ncbi:MAG: putative CMGC kinase, CK2 family [Streblomastix strix]|uniref:non-specific serine/threonine protein kinase n=1 Tax=Streblomastix strix TaxID=222440 RepID=A0A5J4USU0_9EUKA|nr:MAG: putative CMGC kinase, CK2 family [Streblomastix strix]